MGCPEELYALDRNQRKRTEEMPRELVEGQNHADLEYDLVECHLLITRRL